jgi:dTDP-4-dehydrorhamnose reductase
MPRPERILLLGGSGQLGQALARELVERGRDFVAPPRRELDLLDAQVAGRSIEQHAPSLVVYTAAYNDVARAELATEREHLCRLNRDTPAALARAAERSGARFVFFSTDYVFDGAAERPYREDDAPVPLQAYGRSKLEGERAVGEVDSEALIVRTSTLFGPGPRTPPNFVDAILAQARTQERLGVASPPVAAPTFTIDLARAVLRLVDERCAGIVHVTNSGQCSRLELAREAVRAAGSAARIEERPEAAGGPRRPRFCVLDCARLAEWTGLRMRPWQEALAEHVRRVGAG